jgi:hypothetical protein
MSANCIISNEGNIKAAGLKEKLDERPYALIGSKIAKAVPLGIALK